MEKSKLPNKVKTKDCKMSKKMSGNKSEILDPMRMSLQIKQIVKT